MFQVQLFALVILSTMAALGSAQGVCEGYFCGKSIDEIHIVMTHNSLSTKGIPKNQVSSQTLVKQFQAGVRGFNLDLLEPRHGEGSDLRTCHGTSGSCYDPTEKIEDLVTELKKPENRCEIIVIQVENKFEHEMNQGQIDNLLGLFGSLLIRDYTGTSLTENIENGRQVHISTDRDASWTNYFWPIGSVFRENDYDWEDCRYEKNSNPMPTDWRYGGNQIKLMNSFCAGNNIPRKSSAKWMNKKCKLLENARRFRDKLSATSPGNFENLPNILMLDWYNIFDGEDGPFGAQACLRDGDDGSNGNKDCDC